jgi:hypothetical protein
MLGALYCAWTKVKSTSQKYAKLIFTEIIGLVEHSTVLNCWHRVILSVWVLWLFLFHRWGKWSTRHSGTCLGCLSSKWQQQGMHLTEQADCVCMLTLLPWQLSERESLQVERTWVEAKAQRPCSGDGPWHMWNLTNLRGSHGPITCRLWSLYGLYIRYPAYQIFTLQFITVVKLQLWNNIIVRGHHMRYCIKGFSALGRLRTTAL